jgi:hypothetical protein
MDGRQRDMMNFTETLENYVGNGEEVMLEMKDYSESVVAELEEKIARLDELLLEKQDTIANLTARLNNRLGG